MRSALTATLATRMVPMLARDARRLHDAQRCRPGAPVSRLALVRAVAAGALDRAVDVAATLEVRGYGSAVPRRAGAARPWSRHDLAFAGSACALALIGSAALVGGSHAVPGLPAHPRVRSTPAGARAAELRSPAVVAGAVRRPPGRGPVSVLRFDRVTYTYPGEARPALRDASLAIEPGRVRRVGRRFGVGEVDAAARRVRAGPALPRRRVLRAGRGSAGFDTREHGPAASAAVAGTLFQEPETQIVMGTVARRAGVPAREPRAGRGRGRARRRGGGARARNRAPARPLDGRSVAAASSSGSRSGRRWPGARGWCCSTSRRRSLTRSPGDELLGVLRRLNEEWGTAVLLAEHRLERCLSAADRVLALSAGAVAFDGGPVGVPRRGLRHDPATPGRAPVLDGRAVAPSGIGPGRSAHARVRGAGRAAPGGPSYRRADRLPATAGTPVVRAIDEQPAAGACGARRVAGASRGVRRSFAACR